MDNDKRLTGSELLNNPLLNKGTAFSDDERKALKLTGLLPKRHETIEQQVSRCYQQFSNIEKPIDKYVYLRELQETNETLFYRLVQTYIEEMMPIIYTPVVGEGCERFSEIYRQPRGVFITYPDRESIDEILDNVSNENVKVIVVTDGSRILGLGDQGAGGMGIPIGKLSLYTVCAGVNPAYTLPITLDVGTNNQQLLDDPEYVGWNHNRIEPQDYDAFLESFVTAVKKRWPEALLQFEDFEQSKALPLLNRYRDDICCFNDDIQGTAAVTVGTLLAASHVKSEQLSQQRIVFVGAGAAGCGIAEQIVDQMCAEGLSEQQARSQIYMVGRDGLLIDGDSSILGFQQNLAQKKADLTEWKYSGDTASLMEVIQFASPTVLIGVSGQPGLFTEALIKTMQQACERPVIFPLSNPSKQIEARPEQLIEWTDGLAIIATGSPFTPIEYKGKSYPIPQCNNSYIFPGFGLAVIAAKITRISDEMLMLSSEILAEASPVIKTGQGALLPPLAEISELSKKIAFAIAKLAQEQGHAPKISDRQLNNAIEDNFWLPEYR